MQAAHLTEALGEFLLSNWPESRTRSLHIQVLDRPRQNSTWSVVPITIRGDMISPIILGNTCLAL